MIIYAVFSEVANCHVITTTEPPGIGSLLVVDATIRSGTPIKIALETLLNAISGLVNSGPNGALVAFRITLE